MRVCTVVGARPQFIKAAVVSRALADAGVRETLVHTGQHYDTAMSAVFFETLGLPAPTVNLGVGSGSHAVQTGEMMIRLEDWLGVQPVFDWLVVYGDTNSTLAAALVAAKEGVPLAHVEAGLRSFNRAMPEEINRIVTDRLAQILFCPTKTAVANLEREGVAGKVVLSGDVMLDAVRQYASAAETAPLPGVLQDLRARDYAVATIHRPSNTDAPERFSSIVAALGDLERDVVFVAHPRVSRTIEAAKPAANVRVVPPLGYLEMLRLVRSAALVLTDSGGLQKEAFWLGVPCITFREETEWDETLVDDWNQLVGADRHRIVAAARVSERLSGRGVRPTLPSPAEQSAASRLIVSALTDD